MRKLYLFSTLVLTFLLSRTIADAQDFSNKGKEFWLCFPNHIPSGATGQMSIWITSDRASSGTVTITNGSFTAPFTVAANGIVSINIPHSLAHLSNAESGIVNQKSINVKVNPGQPAVVAYAQQYGNARSAATLLLPKNVLGKKYYAISYTQNSTTGGGQTAMSHFQIIATKPNTNVTITPRFNGILQPPINISLPNIGDLYQYQASQDITGSVIESIAGASGGCSPIAVFSGSSATTFGSQGCSGGQNSYDPLFQQLYPTSSWGKNFGFIPMGDYTNGNPYRIMASENNTTVRMNGAIVATLNAGEIYPNTFNNSPVTLTQPTSITADKPITVAQYAQRRDCSGTLNGDPDMVILNPIEQNIKDITIFASTQQNISRQWINVLIPTPAVPSFRIDGLIPTTAFQPAINIPGYSYLVHRFIPAISGSHILTADSGFNAICYGFEQGNFESYAYSAGTNVKDLYQQIGVSTQYGIEPTPSVCNGSPFRFKVSLPYCADSIRWDLSQLPGPPSPSNILSQYTQCTVGAGGPDSTTVVNGVTLYWYSLPSVYTFTTSGSFPVAMTVYKPNNDGCGNEQYIDFELNVYDPPVADFIITNSGCAAEPVLFSDNTTSPRPSYIWNWDFGDPASGPANTSGLQNPSHVFSGPGTYNVTFNTITTPGCVSAQIVKQVVVNPIPTATITGATTVCVNDPQPQVTFTATGGTAPFTFSYHINAGPAVHLNSPTNTITVSVPTGTPGTFTYYLDSVKNTGSSLCKTIYTNTFVDVVVNANTGIALTSGSNTQSVCQNVAITNIVYTLSGGGNNATASGLPAGVNGVYNSGTFTISGTPTTPGTYNYSVTATGLCLPNTLNGTITVNPDAAISLTGGSNIQTVCINTAIAQTDYTITGGGTGATVSGLPAGVTGTFSGGVFTISGSPSVTGTFNYTVNTTGSCLQTSASGTITVNPDATLSLTSAASTTTQAVCENIAITNITYAIGGGGTGGTVSGLPPGVNGVYNAGVFTISGTPTTPGTYNYSVTTTGTCLQRTLGGTITVNPDAVIVLTSVASTTSQELCINSTITNITYSIAGGGTGGTVSGLPTGVTGTFSGGTFTIQGTPTVAGTFNYTVTTTGSCVQKTETGTIIVNPLPTRNFTSTVPTCETRMIQFTDASVPNAGAIVNWQWNFGDPASGPDNTSTLQNPTHIFSTAGTYNVTLVVTTDKGCVSTGPAIPVTVNKRPLAGFIVPEVCLNDIAAQFTDTSKVTLPDFIQNWQWNFGDPGSGPANTSTLQNPQHTYTAVGAYNVQLIAITDKGCRDTIVQQLFINGGNPNADFNVLNPTTLCSKDSVSIADASSVSPGSITKVEIYWDNVNQPAVFDTDDFPAPGKIYKHKYPTTPVTRNYTIRYRAYSGTLCVDDMLRTITVNGTPVVQFNAIPAVCYDAAPFQITQASETGGVAGTGVFSGPGVSPSGIFNPVTAGIGTFTIKYTYTSTAGGCVDSMSQSITVLDTASAQFTYSATVCENLPVSFNSSSSTIPPGAGTITGWNWNFGDPASGAANTSTLQNPTHLFTGWGTYNVTLSVTTSNSCRSTNRVIPVYVNPRPQPNFTFPASACLPSATLAFNSSSSSIADGTQSSFSYLWDFGDPASGANNTSTGANPSHIYNTVGPFTVNLQITSGAGCVNNRSIVVNTIHPQPTGAFNTDKDDICVGETFSFSDNSNPADGTTTQWNWSLGDGNVRTVPSFTYTYATAGTYNVSLYITNSHGCRSSTATRTVTVNPYPVVNAGPDLFILQGGSDTLEAVVTAINPTYLWTPNTYFAGSNTIQNPVVNGVEDITYTLTVTGRGGCISSDNVFIKVLKGPEIPNIFSPNGDGVHDRWIIKYLETYPGGTVEIFNRYGQLIWRSVGYGTPWDGTVNGKPVPIGTYYYIVNPKNGRGIMSGYVDIIR